MDGFKIFYTFVSKFCASAILRNTSGLALFRFSISCKIANLPNPKKTNQIYKPNFPKTNHISNFSSNLPQNLIAHHHIFQLVSKQPFQHAIKAVQFRKPKQLPPQLPIQS